MEEDGEAHAVCECVCMPLRCSAWALIVCLLGAECWAEWGRDGVLIDFGHTSLLLKIPWLLLFCSLSPSFCLPSSNETPNELEHVLTALPLFVSLLLSHRPPSSLSHSGSPCWFLYCPPSTSLVSSMCLCCSAFILSSHSLYHFCHIFLLCSSLLFSVSLFILPSISSPFPSAFPSFIHIHGNRN